MNLTKPQKEIYNMTKVSGEVIAVNCSSMLINGQKNEPEMQHAVNMLFRLNDVLRLRVKETDGQVSQSVTDFFEQKFDVLYFSDKAELDKYAEQYAKKSIPLSGPLCDFKIVILPEQYGLLTKMHHLISDAWTFGLLFSQFNSFMKNEEVSTPPSYFDYCQTEKEYLGSKRFLKDKNFFLEQVKQCESISLFSEKKAVTLHAERKVFILNPEDAKKVNLFAKENNCSVFSVFALALATYISRIKRNTNRFFIGTTILNRNSEKELNTAGLFINTVPLLLEVDAEKSFLENLGQAENALLSVFRHQRYNYNDLLMDIRKEDSSYENLFDVILNYMNATINFSGETIHSSWYHNGFQNESLQIHIDDRDNEDIFKMHYDYQTEKFTEHDIDRMHAHICSLLLDGISHCDKKLHQLNLLSPAEEQQLLYEFNNTAVDYAVSADMSIYSLFAQQTAKAPTAQNLTLLSLSEALDGQIRAYTGEKKSVIAVIAERSEEMYSAIYGIIRGGNAYLPIAPDYPQDRIAYILKDSNATLVLAQEQFMHLAGEIPCINMTEFVNNPPATTESLPCAAMAEDTAYVIYTSGSTGAPKGAKISHKSAINRILWMQEAYPLTADSVILQKTPYTFDVSVWELFWWGMCGGSMVYAKPGEHFLPAKILEKVHNHNVTHLHFVPSVFDLFLTYLEQHKDLCEQFGSVEHVFLSGEALVSSLISRFYALFDFENVKLHNLYGPTECAVDVTYYDCTPSDVDPVPIGRPIANTQIYILDRQQNLLPKGVTGELCIGGQNVGQGYLNNPALTAEKFIDNPFGEGKLYRTGDLAFWREDGNIGYVGRNDFQVKVRGLRIELGEIETAITRIDGINMSVVVVRKDRQDRQLLCAFYTGEEQSSQELRQILGNKLPKYMVPHIFIHLEEIPLNTSGKINRKALPEIDLENIETGTVYVAPETEAEQILVSSVEAVLECENVSLLDNFFDLGGDSLKAIELTSKLEAAGYTVQIKTIFSSQTIQELAKELLTAQEGATLTYDHIMPATPAQMRVYTSQYITPDTPLYNIPYVFKVKDLNPDKLELTINQLIARHESLRTHFESQNGTIMQVIDDMASVEVTKLESDDILAFVKPFDLSKAPLVRVGYYNNTVMMDMHHSILDGESLPVFFRELNELYMGRELPAKVVQYGEFAVQQQNLTESEQYWLSVFEEEVPELTLPTDYARKEKQSFNGSSFYDLIDIQLHEQVKEKAKDLCVTPYAFYMACFNILLSKYSGNEDIVVGMPISGRSSKFLNTIGMFVNTIALRSKPEGNKTVAHFMQEVRDTSIATIEHQNYPLGDLVKKLHLQSDNRNPLFDVMFAYQSQRMTNIVFGDVKAELLPTTMTGAKYDFTFTVLPREEDVVIMVDYCTDLYKEQTIRKFVNSFKQILELCLNEQTLIKDISAISEQETQALLYDLNNTATTYSIPDGATIYSLFTQRAALTPEKICITTADTSITFGSFLSLTEALDAQIRTITKGEKSIIAVIAERSVEMYSAIYGIIRGGNAYLPIAPDYPQERISYILKDSGAALVITQEQFTHLAGDVPCINMTAFLKSTPAIDNIPPYIAQPEDTAYVIYTSGSTGNPKGAKISHKSAINRILWMQEAYPLTADSVILQKTPYTFDVSVWELFWWGMCDGSLAVSKPGEHFLPAKILEAVYNYQVTHLHFVPSVFDLFLTYLEAHTDLCYQFQSVKHVFLSGEALAASLVKRFYTLFDYEKVKLHNLYGPTECAVDVTYYDCTPDEVDPVPIGRPIANTQIYILDQHQNLLPQGVKGELCIGGTNVGQGYLNNPVLTAEKFINNPFSIGKLYRTGDLSYIREDGQIIFCGRMDHQIKLNGQRIELGEIENSMVEIDGVIQCAVIVRKDNDNRQLICAFYIGKKIDAKEFRAILSAKLPKYMIPHIFTHLEDMPMTASGKTNRNALPKIDLNISAETEFVAPNTQEEKTLAEVVCSVLRINSINMLDNFFHLGGDSINAIHIVSELEGMGYELHVADMMQSDTLLDVAKAMKATSDKAIYDQGEVTGIVPFSPIMRAFLNESNNTIPKDFVHTCIISADCDEDTARKALDVLTSHHDILRGTFCDNGIAICPSGEREVYAFQAITMDNTDKAKAYLNNNIKIDDDKLIHVVFCKAESESLISITIHHFLIDLISWEVLMEDFKTVVNQLKNNEECSLPAKTASFLLWNEELQNYAETISPEAKAYWENINNALDNTNSICSYQEHEAETYSFTLDGDIASKLLNEVNTAYGTRTNEVLLTALGLAAGKIADGSVGIMVESHGRTGLHKPIAIDRTIGWFTSCYPVVIDKNSNITDALIQTKETMRRIPKNGIEYLLLSQGFHKNTDIIFNFYQNSIAEEKRRNELIAFHSETSLFSNKISVDCSVAGNNLTIRVSVPKCNHKLHITKELGMEFVKQIEKLVDICTATDTVVKTRSDFSDDELTEIELDELKDLFDWVDDDEE